MTVYSTVVDAASALRSGRTTSVALATEAIAVADDYDEQLGAFIARYNEQALAAAASADADFAAGLDRGPLQGIPIGVKDVISTREGPTTAQSLVLDPQWGIDEGDAIVVRRLRAAGALIMGKLTTSEFAIGMPDFDRPFPIPRNPWRLDHWSGGSSSGSASGVASGMVLGALGTDSGGSIRMPASFCGVSGLKPTFGRIPKSGCVPLGFTLDHVGPLARTARDIAVLLSALAGYDRSDPSSAELPVPDYMTALTGDLSGLVIGVQRLEAFACAEDPALALRFGAALAALEAAGADLIEIELPLYAETSAACFIVLVAEALSYHMRDLQERWSDYGPDTRRTLGMALAVSGADYVQAQRVRRVTQKAVAELFTKVDVVITPTASCGALRIDELARFGEVSSAIHTRYWDMVGNPAISVPMGFNQIQLPLGLQIVGRPFEEAAVLRVADAFQRRTDWHTEVPRLGRASR